MTAYLAGRDVMQRRNADWHEQYTLPSLWDFYLPSRVNHGSYFFDWTSWDETAWRNFYRVWMSFLNDYKNMGGRVTVSSDAGYIFNTFGFAHHLGDGTAAGSGLPSAGGDSRGATLHGAQALHEPKGKPIEFGVVRPGLLADLVDRAREPGREPQGALRHGRRAPERADGQGRARRRHQVHDQGRHRLRRAKLLADVARMVEKQKPSAASRNCPAAEFPAR